MATEVDKRLAVLDGWRGISILVVLAAHLLPLGPKAWRLNEAAGVLGMALFFSLSGFLITRFLLANPHVPSFLVRRFFRIVPLAWLYLLVVLTWLGASAPTVAAHVFFFANLPPYWFVNEATNHLWSLCAEVQFYVLMALWVAVGGRRGLRWLPVLALAVTAARVVFDAPIAIVTWFRVDEILAGACVALLMHLPPDHGLRRRLAAWLQPWCLVPLLLVASHPSFVAFNYLRPYAAAALVASTLLQARAPWQWVLTWKPLVYVATISFALYVIHFVLATSTWLGSGEGWVKYSKRPLLFAVLWGMAHVSTFYFEARCIAWGRRVAKALEARWPLRA